MMQVFPSTVLVPGDSAAAKILSFQHHAFFKNFQELNIPISGSHERVVRNDNGDTPQSPRAGLTEHVKSV
jgi:hypothetical protein